MRRAWFVMFAMGLGCERTESLPPAGQIRLHVMTDAILPVEQPGALARPALFDRLRIELYARGETVPCAGCTREFTLDEAQVNAGRASVGLFPAIGRAGYRARVRIYRGAGVVGTEPPREVTIDRVVELPVVAAEGIIDATVTLMTDELGQPSSLEHPVATIPGAPVRGIAGTWPGATRVDCAEPPRPGEVCVPGGAYWMGDPQMVSGTQFQDDPQKMRLVIVSPFYLGATEVNVRDFRASGLFDADALLETLVFPVFGDPIPRQAAFDERLPNFWCNYRQEADGATRDGYPLEDLPVNCITRTRAETYCHAQGGELPTEAQFEYAASGLASRPYVWGSDDPSCTDAVWGVAGLGVFRALWANCLPRGGAGGPRPPGSGARDRLDLPTGTVFDLHGNVNEWARDTWARSSEPCWQFALARDPMCTTPSAIDVGFESVRGGAWPLPGITLRSSFRQGYTGIQPFGSFVGFRCARPSPPP